MPFYTLKLYGTGKFRELRRGKTTKRQLQLRPLSRSQSSQAISGAVSHNSLNHSPRNIYNALEFEQQGTLLAPQSSEAMPTVVVEVGAYQTGVGVEDTMY